MISLDYNLEEAGWAIAKIGNGEKTVVLTVSYLHDTLKDLAKSAIYIKEKKAKRIVFMDEPGEHHLILNKISETEIEYELKWYEDWIDWNAIEDKKYKSLLLGKTKITRYINEVRNILIEIYDSIGIVGYKEKWINHEFPLKEFKHLK
ncbi:hypothetical protein [Winogradskyella sp.]|uniref:hypothetical protein n=1 Tax=Winogradskyella sp. TaxID=1883156 RepID=UPI00351769AD